jgi:hypothetical protein
MKDFEFISERAKHSPSDFVSNPINGFILVKKLSKDLDEVFELLSNQPDFKSNSVKNI